MKTTILPKCAPVCLLAALAGAATAAPPAEERTPWTTSHVRGTPDPPAPYEVAPVLGGQRLERPTCAAALPGSSRILFTELDGRIRSIDGSAPGPADLVIDLAVHAARGTGRERSPVSLFDLTLHPDFDRNRHLFVSYVDDRHDPGTFVSRLTISRDDPPTIDAASEKVILRWPSGGHNGGCLRFGPDGKLYISTGDGAGPNPPDKKNAGQDVSNLLASVLRIDVDSAPAAGKSYVIPADNPFVATANARPEIWAYGFRNPWKMGFDQVTGDLWLGDVGWETWEMVHRIERGGNYGWSVMEGRVPLRTEIRRGPTPIRPPVKDHPRHEANSITGGLVYRGRRWKDLVGSFVYGDWVTGKIWAIRRSEDGRYVSREIADTDLRIIAFAEGADGELFVLDYDYTGQLYELRAVEKRDTARRFPRKLSETGLFTSVRAQRPAPGVLPYRIVAEPWLDGATARRWIALPGETSIDLARSGELTKWRFPEGAVFVRTLSTDVGGKARPMETQLLHHERGTWRPYTYAWNEAGDDATLLDAGDETVIVPGTDGKRTWHYWGRGECVLCHNVQIGSVLGFEPAQLDLSVSIGGQERDQLRYFRDAGIFTNAADGAVESPGRYRVHDPHDTTNELGDRARSYLHVNCGICHHRRGDGTITIFLRRDLALSETKLVKTPNVGEFGISSPRVIGPGDPYGSIVLYRVAKLGYARMPHVGSRRVDSRGVALLHEWITALEAGADEPRISEKDATALRDLSRAESSRELEERATQQLLGTTRGALALVRAIHAGRVPASQRERIVALAQRQPSDVRGLFETFLPESERRKELGVEIDPRSILGLEGDVDRGRLIYFSDSVTCKTCHPLGGEGATVGPDLNGVGKKYPRKDLLRHILEPSAEIAPEYATYLIISKSGDIYTGIVSDKRDDSIVVTTAGRETIRLDAEAIRSLSKQSKSLMPELLLRDLTAQEAADLVAFLLSQRQDSAK